MKRTKSEVPSVTPRGEIEVAAGLQDQGFSVILIGPTDETFIDLFDEIVDNLDVSRVVCYSQGQVQVAFAQHPGWHAIFLDTQKWDQSLLLEAFNLASGPLSAS